MKLTDEIDKTSLKEDVPEFSPGDTVKVHVRVVEGNRERTHIFEGAVIGRQGGGIGETFTVRKVSHGEGVERVFPLYSPMLESINLVRRGKVRRSKLYYLRQRSGKSARIAEKKDIIKKVNQTPSNKKTSKKEAKINSLENNDSIQKTEETINQDVDKENKKEST